MKLCVSEILSMPFNHATPGNTSASVSCAQDRAALIPRGDAASAFALRLAVASPIKPALHCAVRRGTAGVMTLLQRRSMALPARLGRQTDGRTPK